MARSVKFGEVLLTPDEFISRVVKEWNRGRSIVVRFIHDETELYGEKKLDNIVIPTLFTGHVFNLYPKHYIDNNFIQDYTLMEILEKLLNEIKQKRDIHIRDQIIYKIDYEADE